VAIERGRESTLTACHSCHRPRIPFRHVLIERRCTLKHCKKRHKQTRTTRVRFVTRRRRTSSCRIFSTTHHYGWRRGHRERERERAITLTVLHSCHRTRIPVGHVLIERRCAHKHCKKREGCKTKKRKTKSHHTNTTSTRSRFKPQKKEQNV